MRSGCGSAAVLLLNRHWPAPEPAGKKHWCGRVETTVAGTSHGVRLSRGKGDIFSFLYPFQNDSAVEPWRCHRQHPGATTPDHSRHLYHLSHLSRASTCCGLGSMWPCDLPSLSSRSAASPMSHVPRCHHFGYQWPLYGLKGASWPVMTLDVMNGSWEVLTFAFLGKDWEIPTVLEGILGE